MQRNVHQVHLLFDSVDKLYYFSQKPFSCVYFYLLKSGNIASFHEAILRQGTPVLIERESDFCYDGSCFYMNTIVGVLQKKL